MEGGRWAPGVDRDEFFLNFSGRQFFSFTKVVKSTAAREQLDGA